MNRYFKFSISLMTLLGLVYAQSSVQGTVKEGSGNPLSGANVVVDGTTVGAAAAADGSYRIDI